MSFAAAGIRLRRAPFELRVAGTRTAAFARARLFGRDHRWIGEQELREQRRSETLYVFGSGSSLKDLTPAEIEEFERHDVMGFNWFVRQDLVRTDFHLVREVASNDFDKSVWMPELEEYFRLLRENRRYADTVLILQSGWRAINANRALGLGLVPHDARLFGVRSVLARKTLSASLESGLSHPHSTLDDCINFGYILGWTRIVLVGVDLYDRRYFWLARDKVRPDDEANGVHPDEPHLRAAGMVESIGGWAHELGRAGVRVEVYNPRSLLAAILPVHPRPT